MKFGKILLVVLFLLQSSILLSMDSSNSECVDSKATAIISLTGSESSGTSSSSSSISSSSSSTQSALVQLLSACSSSVSSSSNSGSSNPSASSFSPSSSSTSSIAPIINSSNVRKIINEALELISQKKSSDAEEKLFLALKYSPDNVLALELLLFIKNIPASSSLSSAEYIKEQKNILEREYLTDLTPKDLPYVMSPYTFETVKSYIKILRLNPKNQTILGRLHIIMRSRDDTKHFPKEAFEIASEFFPEDSLFYTRWGEFLFSNETEAIEKFRKAIELDKHISYTYYLLGKSLYNYGSRKYNSGLKKIDTEERTKGINELKEARKIFSEAMENAQSAYDRGFKDIDNHVNTLNNSFGKIQVIHQILRSRNLE